MTTIRAKILLLSALMTAIMNVAHKTEPEFPAVPVALNDNLDVKKLEAQAQVKKDIEFNKLVEVFKRANPDAHPGDIESAVSAVLENADNVFTVDVIMNWLNEETNYKFYVVSSADAIGVAQIQPETGMWIAKDMAHVEWNEWNLYEPGYCIDLGIAYLKYLNKQFNGDLHRTFTAYNQGVEGSVEQYERNQLASRGSFRRGTYKSDYSENILGGKQK